MTTGFFSPPTFGRRDLKKGLRDKFPQKIRAINSLLYYSKATQLGTRKSAKIFVVVNISYLYETKSSNYKKKYNLALTETSEMSVLLSRRHLRLRRLDRFSSLRTSSLFSAESFRLDTKLAKKKQR
jgi:hypothetical protein